MTSMHRRFTLGLLGSTAIAAPLLLVLDAAPASAQANCGGAPPTSLSCQLTTDQYGYIQLMASYPSSTAGKNVLNGNLTGTPLGIQNIFLNATTAQRQQAWQNANYGISATNMWGMVSSAPLSPTLFLNASSFSQFPAVTASAGLAATILGQMGNQPYAAIQNVGAYVIASGVERMGELKNSFSSYNSYYMGTLQLSTQYATPSSGDMRPFGVSSAIANAPWTVTVNGVQTTLVDYWQGIAPEPAYPSGHAMNGHTTSLIYAMLVPQTYQSMMVAGQQFGLSRNIMGVHYPLDVISARVVSYYVVTQLLAGNPLYAQAWTALGQTGTFASTLQNWQTQIQNQLGSSIVASPYASCASNVAACIANGTFPSAAAFTSANEAYALQSTYGLPLMQPAVPATSAPANAYLLLGPRFPYLTAQQQQDVLTSTMLPSGVPLDDGSGWARLNLYAAAGGYGAFNNGMVSITMNAALGGFNAFDFWTNNISGSGGLTLNGTGVLVLGGTNTYTGGTVVNGGTLALSGSMIGSLTVNPGGTFVTGGGYTVLPGSTLTNAGTFQSASASLALQNQGTLNNSGTFLSNIVNYGSATNSSTITGAVTNNGSFTNNGTVNGAFANNGLLNGSGTVVGNVSNSGQVAPGNSIGTMTVAGNYAQAAGGTYAAEVAGGGVSDLLTVSGTATLGGQVVVTALPGMSFAPSTTYTILNATGGLSGTFASVNELYPFLQSSLSYDANNVYLNLEIGGFAAAGATPTQIAVGTVLDANVNNATGDFATVLGAMAFNTTSNAQAQATLQALSGNNYAGFSTSMVQGMQLFMNNFANQTGGGGSPMSNRVALAEACDVACDATTPPKWGAWGSALGGLGTIGAGQPVGTVTYNAGGFAAGLDRLVTDTFRMGVTAGYSTGTQWVGGFDGLGRSNTFQVGLYGGFAQDKVYADGVIGYAYTQNQMWRNIAVPGLQPRTAYGQTGANQWYGQLETGYRFDIGTNANAFVTPFARLQAYTANQNAFTETGAQSLNLSVAQQTTNSLRSVIGAQLGGSMDLGWREKLAMQLRLGWSHEYADVGRPVTATLAGAPAMPFTTWGVSPQRDGVVIGLSANTAVAEATSVYLRYEGDVSAQDSAHAITAGVRMTW